MTSLRKKSNDFYFIGGRQIFDEELHAILLLAFSDEKNVTFLLYKVKISSYFKNFFVRKRAPFPYMSFHISMSFEVDLVKLC